MTYQVGTLLYGNKGPDVVVLPEGYYGESAFRKVEAADQPVWLVFDDRRIYRPGEEPHVKGWLRRQGMRRGGDVGMTPDYRQDDRAWTAYDARGAEVTKGETTIDDAGGFDFSFKVPTTANLGPARVQLAVQDSALPNPVYSHSLSFEESSGGRSSR